MSEDCKVINDYVIEWKKVIGEGSYSSVYKGFHGDTKEVVAIKVVKLSLMADKYIFDMIEQEIKAMKQLDHPNIVNLLEVLCDQENTYIVSEFCNGGDLE